MKSIIAIFICFGFMIISGCAGTNVSPQGGIVAQDEGFSFTVPTSNTIKQGEELTVSISLIRGAYFKQDVQLEVKAEGINVAPLDVLVKSSDKPDVQFQIVVPKDAAIGEYRVNVKGTPETGEPTSTEFIVKVVSQ